MRLRPAIVTLRLTATIRIAPFAWLSTEADAQRIHVLTHTRHWRDYSSIRYYHHMNYISPDIESWAMGGHVVSAFRIIIPEPQNRQPISWRALPYFLFPLLGLFVMAALARRPNTWFIRMTLLPVVILSSIWASFNFMWTDPILNVYNWGQCLFTEVLVAKALEFGFSPNGFLKLGEQSLGESRRSVTSNGHGNGHDHVAKKSPEVLVIERPSYLRWIPDWLKDGIELSASMRGIGWEFGRGVYIPNHTRPLDRTAFLRATSYSFIRNFLLVDFLEWLLKLFPGVGDPQGGSIFYAYPPLQRYAISTSIHIISGSCLLAGFGMCYDLLTLFSVIGLNDPPDAWPPVVDNPWISDSLHEFWAKRWHQLLRQTFVTFGGVPGKLIAGNFGMVFGTFIASGFYHECAIYAMGHGFDYRVPLFFAIQGPLLVVERVWRQVTGRRVGGWPGRLWVYLVIFFAGQHMIDAWHLRGLGGGMVIPSIFSPARMILFPVISSVISRWQQ